MSAFFKVTVVLTAKEYATLRHEAAFLGPGTVGSAIRKRLGWYVTPYGYVKWATAQLRATRTLTQDMCVGVLNDHTQL